VNPRLWLLSGLLAVALACDDKPKTTPPAPTAIPTTAPVATAAPAATGTEVANAAMDEIATEEDFEEEAQGEISAQNMEAELDKLEKEIGD